MHRFARTVRRDLDAVTNALTEEWSNGQTEGYINRLKTLKRAMYGRAGAELLRAVAAPCCDSARSVRPTLAPKTACKCISKREVSHAARLTFAIGRRIFPGPKFRLVEFAAAASDTSRLWRP
jgi:hypothetical protein